VPGVARGDLDRRGHQEPFDLGHRRGEPGALAGAERPQDGRGQIIGAPVKLRPLGQPAAGESRRAYPPVGPALFDDDEPVILQRPQ
jgi:hypothetical protein